MSQPAPHASRKSLGQFNVRQLRIPVDVVDTAGLAPLEHELDAAAVVIDMDPAATGSS
jgi:hypothetical protein